MGGPPVRTHSVECRYSVRPDMMPLAPTPVMAVPSKPKIGFSIDSIVGGTDAAAESAEESDHSSASPPPVVRPLVTKHWTEPHHPLALAAQFQGLLPHALHQPPRDTYPLYPWLLSRHGRIFPHRFPGGNLKLNYYSYDYFNNSSFSLIAFSTRVADS